MRYVRFAVLGLCCAFSVPLTACMYEPDHFSTSKLQVEEKPFSETLSSASIGPNEAGAMAKSYTKNGEGPFDMTVTYDPSQPSAAMKASDEAARISGLLRRNGIQSVQSSILPVNGLGPDMKVMIGYTSVSALAPEDCTLMPGMTSRTIEAEEEYKLGCTVDTLYSLQIARAKDLKGQDAHASNSDGRRASNIVEIYRTGEPNPPLEGEQASGD